MPDPIAKLVDRALPATWPDDLAAKLGAQTDSDGGISGGQRV